MKDIVHMIQRDIEDDISINSHGVKISAKRIGLIGKKRSIIVSGMAENDIERNKIIQIVEHHAGDAYHVVDKLSVKAHDKAV